MRPKKQIKRTAGVSRARMYIRRDLGWVHGFPVGPSQWLELPPSGPSRSVAIDRKLTRKATRTISMLLRDFPRGLPRLVGDKVRWADTHRGLLEVLKPTIHKGAALPRSPLGEHPFASASLKNRARRARTDFPALAPSVAALEWCGWTDLKAATSSLKWLVDSASSLEPLHSRVGKDLPALVVRLWQLAQSCSPKRVSPILTLLGNEQVWARPLECKAQYIHEAAATISKKERPAPEHPTATLPVKLIAWVHWLAEQEAAVHRRGLDLFATLVGTELVESWGDWWSKFDGAFDRARRLPVAQRKKDPIALKRRKARAGLERLGQRVPPAIPSVIVDSVLRMLPTQETEPLFRVVSRALSKLPRICRGSAFRLAFAEHWMALWIQAEEAQRPALLRYIPAFAAYAAPRCAKEQELAPWQQVWTRMQEGRGNVYTVDDDALEALKSRAGMDVFFDVLGGTPPPISSDQAELLCSLAAYMPKKRVGTAFDALRGTSLAGKYLGEETIRFVSALTADHTERFADVLTAVEAADDRYEKLDKLLRPAVAAFGAAQRLPTLLDAIGSGSLNVIAEAGFKLAVISEQGVAAPRIWRTRKPDSSWSAVYPDALQPALAELAHYDPEAAQTARRVLAKDFPDREATRRELDRLRSTETPSESQKKRVANLESRLSQRPSVSPKRLMNLEAKLRASTGRKVLALWRTDVDTRFQQALPDYLGADRAPEWAEQPDVLRALLPIRQLKPSTQVLARRILAMRCGDPPWDFRDAPPNRAFLDRLRSKGIDPETWIADSGATEATTKDGRLLTLGLERDPLAVLNMGGYFNTCLSPGAFNFFSVFANIADINKQVMYARYEDGRVFGRMLLAITNEGGLLPFHPYAHSQKVGFDAIAKDFAQSLARRMKTLVVSSGAVATLVADDWYDDGPVDLTQSIEGLADGSAFRQSIANLPVGDLMPALRRAVSPFPLNELTLPMILALPELESRGDLMATLLPLVRRVTLPVHALAKVAGAVSASGAADLAPILDQLYQGARSLHGHYFPYDAAILLSEHAPLLALKLVRETRRRDVRSWDDEWDGARLLVAARANESLRRRNKATALYGLAARASLDNDSKEYCRAAIERLRG